MKMKKVVGYLSSPYTNKDPVVMNRRYTEICIIADALKQKGLIFFAPICQSVPISGHSDQTGSAYTDWQEFDIEFVKRCDEIWVVTQPGWRSSGA